MSKLRVTVYSRRSRGPVRTLTVSNLAEAEQASKEFPGMSAEQTKVSRRYDGSVQIDVSWPDLGESYQYGIVEPISDHQS